MHQVRRVLYGKPAVALEIGEDARDAARANDFELQVSFYHNGDDKFQMIRIQNSQNWQFFTFTMINSSIISILAVTNKIISNKRQALDSGLVYGRCSWGDQATKKGNDYIIILYHFMKIISLCHDYHIIILFCHDYHIII